MSIIQPYSRRRFLAGTAGVIALGGCATTSNKSGEGEKEVSPAEDLMREHGLLERILLVYEEAANRLVTPDSPAIPGDALMQSAQIVRAFVEDYHERLEEQFVFPALEQAGREVELVKTLRTQHDAGRAVTDRILQALPEVLGQTGKDRPAPQSPEAQRLAASLRAYIRMYRPHAAREDTVLFPAFKQVTPGKRYDELGELFEDREHQLFGAQGFEKNVAAVAGIERAFGIENLAQFTPA